MRVRIVMAFVALSSLALIAQGQVQPIPRDDGYVTTHKPKGPAPAMDARVKDDAAGRKEAQKEQFGGDFTPKFMESLMTAANQQSERSTDGGETWSAGIKLGAATIIPDIKVDTTGAQDVVLVATNAGLFRSLNGGNSYGTVINGGLHWSLEKTSAGWVDALTSGGNAVFARAVSAAGAWTLDFTAGGMAPA